MNAVDDLTVVAAPVEDESIDAPPHDLLARVGYALFNIMWRLFFSWMDES